MQFYKIASYFPDFGVNKKQEIERLVYEISKRDKISPGKLLGTIDSDNFEYIKNKLLKIRFPYAYKYSENIKPHLPKLSIKPENRFKASRAKFKPARIFIEKLNTSSALKNNFKKHFPEANFTEISSMKDFIKSNKAFGIPSYNKRRENIFITNEDHDFFKACPCTKGARGCGYHIFNLGFGCIFDCAYCYLQEYSNIPGLVFPSNIDRFFDRFSSYKKPGMRIGTGEFSDSLMLDHITEYSNHITEFFRKHPDTIFEFKTKSSNIANLLKARHSGNIVISWSLNPQKIINKNEFLTASLRERLDSAKKCAKAGYRIGFHFDPVIYFKGWETEYLKVIDLLFSAVKPKDIAWISIGTFRFKPELKPIIENRFPDNKILDEELLLGYDNKLRYPYNLRCAIYAFLISAIKKHSKKIWVYLCMEESSMHVNLSGENLDSSYRPGGAFILANPASNT